MEREWTQKKAQARAHVIENVKMSERKREGEVMACSTYTIPSASNATAISEDTHNNIT